MRFHAAKAGWSVTEIARAMVRKDRPFPRIDFVAEAQTCDNCARSLAVQKSKTRLVITREAGPFEVREVLKTCDRNKSHSVFHSERLSKLVKPRQRYGYDLIVHVGLARYLDGKQREEIRAELYPKIGVELPDGTITNLCDRFLIYLETLHLVRAPILRNHIQADGYQLHLDATCDKGKGGVFVCLDGYHGWVLMAGKIPSENEEYMKPLIERTVELFGDPISTMRDLGRGITKAVEPLKARGILDLVCHYHFLRALGVKLFDTHYSALRNLLRRSRVRSQMRAVLRELRNHWKAGVYNGCFGAGQIREDLLALVYWLLEGDGKKKPDYPFTLVHLEFFQRCQELIEQADCWVPLPRTQPEQQTLNRLIALAGRFKKDKRFDETAAQLERRWQTFCELRDVLRMTDKELSRREDSLHQPDFPMETLLRLCEIEQETKKYVKELQTRVGNEIPSNSSSPEAITLKYLMEYDDNLFGQPVLFDENGSVISVFQRTNFPSENRFNTEKHRLRRRLGKANLGRDLEDQPAQAFFVSNLRHQDYVRIVCGSLDNLPELFANLDSEKLVVDNRMLRDNMKSRLKQRVNALLEMHGKSVEELIEISSQQPDYHTTTTVV